MVWLLYSAIGGYEDTQACKQEEIRNKNLEKLSQGPIMILNLDPTFQPFGEGVSLVAFDFPTGFERHLKFQPMGSNAIITTRIKTANDIMAIFLAVSVMRGAGIEKIELVLPFLPFARQDRQTSETEPFSLKVMANLINAQGFSKVHIFDPHSDVSIALIENAVPIKNHILVGRVLFFNREIPLPDYLIVSPDAGAYKKIFDLCRYLNYKNKIILCNKVRDVSNGQILATEISEADLGGKDVFIVDDICDGGATFIGIAQELKKRNCGKINLIVSHGIFSKGEEPLKPHIDHIYTTNSIKDIQSDYITQIKLDSTII